ncbi:hypothetical protein DV738_g245, partial [Chaetothyriales sp. CBS 135597]
MSPEYQSKNEDERYLQTLQGAQQVQHVDQPHLGPQHYQPHLGRPQEVDSGPSFFGQADPYNVLNILSLPESVARRYQQGVVYAIQPGDRYVINLAAIQRLSLHHLRDRLAEAASKVNRGHFSEEDANWYGGIMGAYCQALRDWDYMLEKHTADPNLDPFKLVNTKMSDLCIMKQNNIFQYDGSRKCWRPDPEKFEGKAEDLQDPWLPGGSRSWLQNRTKKQALTIRTWAAILGGIALVGPMVLMVLYKNTVTALSTVAICTFLFAVILARFTDKGPLELMQATATYAAILVVFVGASS